MTADRTWLQRPSLAYQAAFDRCAVEAAQRDGPVLVLAGNPFYAREIVRRLSGSVALQPFGSGWPQDEDLLRKLLGPEIHWDQVNLIMTGHEPSQLARTIIWAEPRDSTWRHIVPDLQRLAAPDAKAIVLGRSARMGRFLPDQPQQSGMPVPLSQAADALGRAGWRIEQRVGFHGPRSLLLGAVSRVPALLNRDDLLDRNSAAMRENFVVVGRQAHYSPVWMIRAGC